MDITKFEEFISQYPVFEYRILDAASIQTHERVRTICQTECTRYNSTWACPPAVGTVEECAAKIHSYEKAVFFSSVAEVSDVMNMEEMLTTRHAHEKLTDQIAEYMESQGHEVFPLSTESCDICEHCAYLDGEPCRHPKYMHPCIESFGVVVNELVEREHMEYNLGGNTILWFSLILFRE